jgi:membrane fusion protein, heavy metal efflux system
MMVGGYIVGTQGRARMLAAAVRYLVRSIPTVVVLAAMVGIGVWGHHSHWAIPSFGEVSTNEASDEAADQKTPVVAESTSRLPLVRFDSAADVQAAGMAMAVAKRTTVDEWVPASAVVEYNSQRVAQLSCPVAGRVFSIRGLIGRAVRKGEVIALIDAQEVGRAKSEFLQSHLMAKYKADVLAHLRSAGSGSVPPRTILDAETAAKEADLHRFTAHQRLLNLGLDSGDLDQQPQSPQELARAIQFLGVPPDVVHELNPRPTSANLFPLVAPFDGIVIRQDVVPGEVIDPDKAHLEIADVNTMWIKLSVRMEDAAWLDLGQEVEFSSQGLPEAVRGLLTWVSTEIDEKTRTIQARCSVENPVVDRPGRPDGSISLRLLRANQFGAARIRVASHLNSVVVPDAAIQRMPDRSTVVFVALPDGMSFEARTVRLGLARSGLTQVLSGVAPDESVVTRGSYVLKSELMKDSLVGD